MIWGLNENWIKLYSFLIIQYLDLFSSLQYLREIILNLPRIREDTLTIVNVIVISGWKIVGVHFLQHCNGGKRIASICPIETIPTPCPGIPINLSPSLFHPWNTALGPAIFHSGNTRRRGGSLRVLSRALAFVHVASRPPLEGMRSIF